MTDLIALLEEVEDVLQYGPRNAPMLLAEVRQAVDELKTQHPQNAKPGRPGMTEKQLADRLMRAAVEIRANYGREDSWQACEEAAAKLEAREPVTCASCGKDNLGPATVPQPESDSLMGDNCPDCGGKLIEQPRGGVKCGNAECGYWFCF